MDKFVPEELSSLREDGLDFFVENKMTVESYLEILKMQEEVTQEVDAIVCPQLFLLGQEDREADRGQSRNLFEKMEKSEKKEIVEL